MNDFDVHLYQVDASAVDCNCMTVTTMQKQRTISGFNSVCRYVKGVQPTPKPPKPFERKQQPHELAGRLAGWPYSDYPPVVLYWMLVVVVAVVVVVVVVVSSSSSSSNNSSSRRSSSK